MKTEKGWRGGQEEGNREEEEREKEGERGRKRKEGEEKRKNSGWEVCDTFRSCVCTNCDKYQVYRTKVYVKAHKRASRKARY